MQIVAFELDRQRFGVPTGAVERILHAAAATPLPGAPPIVEGVLDVAGAPMAVLDLRSRFGFPPKSMAVSDMLVVVRAGERRVAIRADRVTGVVAVNDEAIHPPEDVTSMAGQIAGVATLSDGVLLVHDPEAFLTQAESAQLDGALAETMS